jgi:hypothetical protein
LILFGKSICIPKFPATKLIGPATAIFDAFRLNFNLFTEF